MVGPATVPALTMTLCLHITCIHSAPVEIAFCINKNKNRTNQQTNASPQSFLFQLPAGVQGCGSHTLVLVLYLESPTCDLSQGRGTSFPTQECCRNFPEILIVSDYLQS